MEIYLCLAVILLIINLVITSVSYLIAKRKNDKASFFGMFVIVDLIVTLVCGFFLMLTYVADRNLASSVMSLMYLTHFLPISALFIIISAVLHYNYKKKQENINKFGN